MENLEQTLPTVTREISDRRGRHQITLSLGISMPYMIPCLETVCESRLFSYA